MKKKTSQPQEYEIAKIIWANIRRYQYINQFPDELLAKMINVTIRMLYSYDKHPDTINLGKIQNFIDEAKIDIHELLDY